MKAIINGRLIVPGAGGNFQLEENKVVIFSRCIEKIISATEFENMDQASFDEVIDAKGKYVSPGFVNVHIHGCVAHDTMDCDVQALHDMADYQAQTGVTSFLPTTMTYDLPRIYQAIGCVKKAMTAVESGIVGVNMEGPFISAEYKGAQKESNIQGADFSLIEQFADIIKIITIAPETLPAGSEFIQQCCRAGMKVSLGHTAASYEQAVTAIKDKGADHITHLFNAMTGLHHRRPGVVGAALDTDVYCELIADNIHCAPAVQRLVHKIKGLDRLVLITDSMRACGLGDGKSELGGQEVFVKGQRATLADGTIAGSVLTMDRAVYNYAQNNNIPVWQAVQCATITPAQSIGLAEKIGSISAGKQADIVLFDDAVNISMTIRRGKRVFSI